MGNILVVVFAVGLEFLARLNPNFENVSKFRNYSYVDVLYDFVGNQAKRFNLNFPYVVPALIGVIITLTSIIGFMLFGKIFSLLVLLYCFRELHSGVANNIFIEFNERYFANLLYFALFGPFAVLLYNFVAIARVKHPEIEKVHAVLAWVPARVAAFMFALVGSFAPAFKMWLTQAANIQVTSSKILTDCGDASLDVDDKQIAERSLIAWAVLCIILLIL